MNAKIKVLVVDDSALVRQVLTQGLQMDPAIEVVGTANDPYEARDKIVQLRPDVLTLDVEMPRMNGYDFLRLLMPQYPLPVIMVSSLTQKGKQITIQCLEAGAVDFVSKPTSDMGQGIGAMITELRTKIRIAATIDVSHWKKKARSHPTPVPSSSTVTAGKSDWVIAIGASTGGTEAIKDVLTVLPRNLPGILIVQHMPPGFTGMFANRLNQLCSLEVREAQNGDQVLPGRVLIAPGGLQMRLVKQGRNFLVSCETGEKVSGHCPSVDVMMHSVAAVAGRKAVGVMLTGMGGDGANGMLAMKQAGARNIAQDQETSVVFGMPKVAWDLGAADQLVPLEQIGSKILSMLSEERIS